MEWTPAFEGTAALPERALFCMNIAVFKRSLFSEAAQTGGPAGEEFSIGSCLVGEPDSFFLVEIAEGIGSRVKEVVKVVEAGADTVRDNLPS